MKITQEEFQKLDKNDKVYYFDDVVLNNPVTFSTSIICVKLKSHAHKYDILHHVYKGNLYATREKALMGKFLLLKEYMNTINDIVDYQWQYKEHEVKHAKSCFKRFERIKKQKNIRILVELYPEKFI